MNKELQALEIVLSYQNYDCYNDEYIPLDGMAKDAYDYLVKYLTQTTALEVEEALSKHTGVKVSYNAYLKWFMDETWSDEIIRMDDNDELHLGVLYSLTPELFEMVGRFYKGVTRDN